MDQDDLQPYINLVLRLFEPLLRATESTEEAENLLRALGYAPPSEVLAFKEFDAVVGSTIGVIDSLDQAIDSENTAGVAPALLQLVVALGGLIKGVNVFQTKIQSNFAGSPLLTQTDILAAIPRKLADYLIVRWLEDTHPTLNSAFQLAGVVKIEDVSDTPTPFHVPYRKREIDWDKLPDLLTNPVASLKANVVSGDELLYGHLITLIDELATSLGLPSYMGTPEDQALEAFNDGKDLSTLPDFDELVTLTFPLINDPKAALALKIYPRRDQATGKFTGIGAGIRFGGQIEIPLSDLYELKLKIAASLNDSLGITIDNTGNFKFINNVLASPQALADSVQFGVKASIEPTEEGLAGKLVSFGIANGSRFEIGSGALSFGVEKMPKLRLFVEGDLNNGLVVLKADEADGFISKLLPADGVTANFNLGIGVANDAGLYFKGSSGLDIRLPLHMTLGPLEILFLGIGAKFSAGKIPVTVTSGFSALLGPLAAVVEDVGIQAVISVKGDRSGNLGPFDVALGFKPPKGVGLSIDAGVVKGGGYLYFDPDRGEYAGALELTFSDFLSLKAIGMITTRMPDGSRGFSLIVIITAEFSPGLQLGYGFTLIGVGGLLGLNRTVVLEALALGVRTGAVNGILFPVDPVANAPRILSDLRTIFPPFENRFLIGPMAKLGWGTPTLVSLALGVIMEIPGNIAILGILKVALPVENAPLIQLQVNFIGAIEFDKKRGWFFAALYESRVLFITLEGEMGVLIAIGTDANFVLSVGGFHPRFSPPPLPFPSPRRISFDIINTPAARIRVEGYFAVTTNTVQCGARAELFFGFDAISVEGHMAFDALIRFSPFYFIVEISAGASLKVFGIGVFSIDLKFTLEGVTPWRARGRGSVSLLFIEISADFDITWGESQDTSLPPIQIVPLLKGEFENAVNWRALPPPSQILLVSLRKLELPPEEIVLHPIGTLEISQNAVPLNITLDKVGAQKPADANRFSVNVKTGGLAKRSDARRRFSPAQFRNMNDAQKLSAPAFQEEISGLVLGVDGAELRTGRAVKRSLRYEVTTIDTYYRRFVKRFSALGLALFGHFIKGASVSKSSLSRSRRKQAQPFDDHIKVATESYAVVFNATNKAAAAGTEAFATESAAREWLNAATQNDPNLRGQLDVVPATEMREAA